MKITMTKKLPSEQSQYFTHDLGCATALISAGSMLVSLDKETPRKVGFIFRSDAKLNNAVEDYGSVGGDDFILVEARGLFFCVAGCRWRSAWRGRKAFC